MATDLLALFDDEVGWGSMDRADSFRILSGEAGDGGGPVNSMRGKGQEVDLDASSRSTIGSGDGECDGCGNQIGL